MSSRFYALLGERITFKQSNTDRYMEIVGRGAIDIGDMAGQGYIKIGRQPLLFQAGLPVGLFGTQNRDHLKEGDELQRLGKIMAEVAETRPWPYRPDPIEILPEIVPLKEMLAQANLSGRRIQAVLGQNSNLTPALFDLKRTGAHFAIVGPAASGKSTVLYNWIFSLAHRYSPAQVQMILLDFQGRLADYEGQESLSQLPHLLASVTRPEEMPALFAALEAECALLATASEPRELFVFIDNFDDFVEELSGDKNLREMNEALATLARKHGRDGLHFVIAGALDSSINELRRRVRAANYGLGLRVANSLNTLGVQKHPPNLKDRVLPHGRGYTVRAGQPSLIQIATPYEGMGIDVSDITDEDEREAQHRIRALDKWVQELRAHYPDQKAVWVSGAEFSGSNPNNPTSELSLEQQRMMTAMQQYLQWEMNNLKPDEDKETLVATQWVRLTPAEWYQTDKVMPLMRQAFVRQMNLTADMVEPMTGAMSDRDVLDGVLNTLASQK
jgi:DNA segregation ATPase FtsK/SpoIIIE, S-DNA-T family